MSKITEYLLPTEQILWHRLPEPKAPGEGRAKFIPILIGVIFVSLFSLLVIYSVLSGTPQAAILIVCYIVLILVGLILIGVGIAPVISIYPAAKDIEYIITNQRVLIYPSAYAEKNRPKIINLYEVNGQIEVKYNKFTDTGSIYIPSPHWYRFGFAQSRMMSGNRAIIDPDIKDIKEPHKVYDILIEAIATGKALKWK